MANRFVQDLVGECEELGGHGFITDDLCNVGQRRFVYLLSQQRFFHLRIVECSTDWSDRKSVV